ncbi:hypothetical protein VF21_09385 [Pseudogymnoascus sp. 05NY08]|nr:hypothetical protein VF21_09385 [Pseudogymnoascus sp. 05NY08]
MAKAFFILILYASFVATQSPTDPSLPIKDVGVGWQDSPSRRGTLTIIEDCAVTIFACTWTIQHLNVPGAGDGGIKRFLRSCKWMLITVLLPEFILAHAVYEGVMAFKVMKAMKDNKVTVEYPKWVVALGGRLGADDEKRIQSSGGEDRIGRRIPWTLTHAYYANMGGFVSDLESELRVSTQANSMTTPIMGPRLVRYWNTVPTPQVSEAAIKDKSKSDTVAKILAVVQILQLALSLIVRPARGLPFSQLEALTLAFAACGVCTYFIYWYKPKNVDVPHVLGDPPAMQADTFHTRHSTPSLASLHTNYSYDVTRDAPRPFHPADEEEDGHSTDHSSEESRIGGDGTPLDLTERTFDSFWKVLTNDLGHNYRQKMSRVPNDNIPIESAETAHTVIIVLAFLSAAFGSLHAIAWNLEFPTQAEQVLWRVATVLSITVPPLGLLGIPFSQGTLRRGSPREFMRHSMRVLRELVWCLADRGDKQEALRALQKLEKIYNVQDTESSAARKDFKDILGVKMPSDPEQGLYKEMIRFVQEAPSTDHPSIDLPHSYIQQLSQLVRLIDNIGSKRMIEQGTKTNVFPRRDIPRVINLGLLYTTSSVYCIARLVLLSIAVSSLRYMPDAVYYSTWTRYIPSIS